MSDVNFWQSIDGRWQQLKRWCFYKAAGTPLGAVLGAFWFDTTANLPKWFDGTNARNFTRVHLHAGIVGNFPVLTNLAGGQVSCGACRVALYVNPDNMGEPTEFDIAAKTVSLTDNGSELIIIDYNAGSPQYKVVNAWSLGDYNLSSNIVIDKKYYAFGDIHTTEFCYRTNDLPALLALSSAQTEPYKRVGGVGLEPSASGLTLIVSGAVVWAGPKRINVLPFNSSTNETEQLYTNAAGAVQSVDVVGFNTTNYNPAGSGLVPLNNNYWTAAWIYRTIGEDVECYIVIHNEQYNSRDNARTEAKTRPLDLPVINEHSILVGRAIFQKGATAVEIDSAWATVFAGGNTSDHEGLTGLLGGDATNGHYHLTQAEQLRNVNAGAANGFALYDASGKIPAANISVTPTGDVSATDVQSAIAELASEKLAASVAATTYAPIKTALVDDVASSALPTTASGSLVSKIQQIRNYLKYLLAQIGTKQNVLTFDSTPTDGSSNPVTSNGVFDALAGKAPTSHASLTDEHGPGTADNFGHVQLVDAVTDGVMKAVTSNAVYDSLSAKKDKYQQIRAYSEANTWIFGGCYYALPRTNSFQNRTTLVRVICYAGQSQSDQYTCDFLVRIKIQFGEMTRSVTQKSGVNSVGKIRSFLNMDSTFYYFHLAVYLPAFCNVSVSIVDGDAPSVFTNTTGDASIATDAGVSDLFLPTVYAPTSSSTYTLPANAPIGKQVFVDNLDSAGVATVNAPSGTTIRGIAGSYDGSSSSVQPYNGRWFIKTTDSRWIRTP